MEYLIDSRNSLLSLEYLVKNYSLNLLFEGKLIQRGDPYQLYREFLKKKNINFQKINLIFNSIFYTESKEFTLVGISRKKLLFEPSV